VDGKKYSQPLVVAMDPRVKASDTVLKEQSDLSMSCYRSLNELQPVLNQIHSLRNQVAQLTPKIKDVPLRDTLTSLGRYLRSLEGDGPPQDVDIVYFTVQGGKSVKETLNGLQTKLLYLMKLLQSADAAPTEPQRLGVRDEMEIHQAMMERWKSFLSTKVQEINLLLKKQQLEPLTIEG
jgi:hypothetical protein